MTDTRTDYEKTYDQFWRGLVETEGGTLDPDKVKRELHDYHRLIGNVSKVYDHITNGRISKPNTRPDAVIAEAEELVARETLPWLQHECWKIADEHGWHDEPRSFGDRIALMHSELSEALEEFRSGRPLNETYHREDGETRSDKPEGVPIELADVVIRILDACEEHGIDLNEAITAKLEYNRTRPYRHGGKAL